jgi:hypothetical protein
MRQVPAGKLLARLRGVVAAAVAAGTLAGCEVQPSDLNVSVATPSKETPSTSKDDAADSLPPTLDAVADLSMLEDASLTVNLTGIGPGKARDNQTITIDVISSNPSLLPNPVVTYTSPQATGSLVLAPAANASGYAIVTLTVSDGRTKNGLLTRSFVVTVSAVNDPPTLDAVTNLTLNEDSIRTVNLTGISGGAANEAETLIVSATSSNPSVLPNPAISYVSPASTGSLTLAPVANAFGNATITVRVSDGTAFVTRTFNAQVLPVNDPPSFDAIADLVLAEDAGLRSITVTGVNPGAPNESDQALTFVASSNNSALIPTPSVSYAAGSSQAVLSFTPVANASGVVTLSLVMTDSGGASVSREFTVTVTAVNDPPSSDPIANLTIAEDSGSRSVTVTGINPGAPNESAQTITVGAVSSSNTALIPTPSMTYNAGASTAVLSFAPVANGYGVATLAFPVTDSGGASALLGFTVNVAAVNDPPTLSAVSDVTLIGVTTSNASPYILVRLDGIGSGASNEAQTLTVTGRSSTPALLPHPSTNYNSPATYGYLQLAPEWGEVGAVTVTATVSDGVDAVSRDFVVTLAGDSFKTFALLAASSPLRENETTAIELEGGFPVGTQFNWSTTNGTVLGTGARVNLSSASLTSGTVATVSVTASYGTSVTTKTLNVPITSATPKLDFDDLSLSGTTYAISGTLSGVANPQGYKIAFYKQAEFFSYHDAAVAPVAVGADGRFAASLVVASTERTFRLVGLALKNDRTIVSQTVSGQTSVCSVTAGTTSSIPDAECRAQSDTLAGTRAKLPVPLDSAAWAADAFVAYAAYEIPRPGSDADANVQGLIRLMARQPLTGASDDAAFVQSYGDDTAANLYDQALALTAYTEAGNLPQARRILRALQLKQNGDGSWFSAYDFTGGTAYSLTDATAEGRYAGAIAWVAMALNDYRKRTGDTAYAAMHAAAMGYLKDQMRTFTASGVSERALRYSPNFQSTTFAVDHNLAAFAAFKGYAELTGDTDFATAATDVRAFVMRRWIGSLHRFSADWNTQTNIYNRYDHYLNLASWAVLALGSTGPSGEVLTDGLRLNCQALLDSAGYVQRGGAQFLGFSNYALVRTVGATPGNLDVPSPDKRFVWAEGTLGQLMALRRAETDTGRTVTCQSAGRTYSWQEMLNSMRRLGDSGRVLNATKSSNSAFSQANSAAGLAWRYFAERNFNPFAP